LKQSFVLLLPLAGYLESHADGRRLTEREARRFAFHLMSMAIGGIGGLVVDPGTVVADRVAWADSVTAMFVGYFEPGLGYYRKS
jgi:hypothetical protein